MTGIESRQKEKSDRQVFLLTVVETDVSTIKWQRCKGGGAYICTFFAAFYPWLIARKKDKNAGVFRQDLFELYIYSESIL